MENIKSSKLFFNKWSSCLFERKDHTIYQTIHITGYQIIVFSAFNFFSWKTILNNTNIPRWWKNIILDFDHNVPNAYLDIQKVICYLWLIHFCNIGVFSLPISKCINFSVASLKELSPVQSASVSRQLRYCHWFNPSLHLFIHKELNDLFFV